MGNTHAFGRLDADSAGRLLLRLYDGALASMTAARERVAAGDCPGKGGHISRAMDLLAELTRSLDLGHGLARNLAVLYLCCTARLLRASARMETGPLDVAVSILAALRQAFAGALPPARRGAQRARVLAFGVAAR
jgi:flagellar protein FliS